MKAQNIIKHRTLSNYMRTIGKNKGKSSFSIYLEKWLKNNKKAKRYYGDLRSEKKHFNSVHKFFAFEPKAKYHNVMYKELNCTYVIE
jgi:hypothetical protein